MMGGKDRLAILDVPPQVWVDVEAATVPEDSSQENYGEHGGKGDEPFGCVEEFGCEARVGRVSGFGSLGRVVGGKVGRVRNIDGNRRDRVGWQLWQGAVQGKRGVLFAHRGSDRSEGLGSKLDATPTEHQGGYAVDNARFTLCRKPRLESGDCPWLGRSPFVDSGAI